MKPELTPLTLERKYFVRTIEILFCKNSTALLAELLRINRRGWQKTLVVYGEGEFIPPVNKTFRVICIKRNGREYKGFVNVYRRAGIS